MSNEKLTITYERFLQLLEETGNSYWLNIAKLWKLGAKVQYKFNRRAGWNDHAPYSETELRDAVLALVFKEGYEVEETRFNCTDKDIMGFLTDREYRIKPEGEDD